MTVGFVMLAHTALDRAGQVARHLANAGCPVVIHVDKRTPAEAFHRLVGQVSDERRIQFAPRLKCDWGTWSLVEATRGAAAMLLDLAPEVSHVQLLSGACLPIKPVEALMAYLDDHPTTDFIESVTIEDVPWTKGGLGEERFTLTFPFAWKRRKRLFDLWVALQRRVGRARAVPDGLVPHMGSQWWCLTRGTLEAILTDPDRARFDTYFSRVWIPDESYFATLARRHSTRIESRALTLSKFDFQGNPHVFYDDHLDLLRQSSAFFARKIWPGARRLYGAFLGTAHRNTAGEPASAPSRIDSLFAEAVQRRTAGRAGLTMAGRFPRRGFENGLTAAPYSVFHGFDEVFDGFGAWASEALGIRVHGHLFAPDRAEFSDGQNGFIGGLSDNPTLRDYNPEAFLRNLIWNTRGEHQSFLFGPRDTATMTGFLARDANAHVFAISGAWALPLLATGRPATDLRAEAALLQAREAAHLERLGQRHALARLRLWTLADVLDNPAAPFRTMLDDLSLPGERHAGPVPEVVNTDGLGAFLQELRNMGMNPHTAGAFFERRARAAQAEMRNAGGG